MVNENQKLIINIGDDYTTKIEEAVLRVADKDAAAVAVTSLQDIGDYKAANGKVPKFMVVNLSEKALGTIEDAQRLQCYNRNTGSVILKGIADIHYLCEEGSKFEESGFNHNGNIEVFEGEFYAVDSTVHGSQIIQSCEPVALKPYNPDDELNIRWHIDDIINYGDDFFITTETARDIMKELKAIDKMGRGIGFDEVDGFVQSVEPVPHKYHDAANVLNINQNYMSPKLTLEDRPLNAVAFFELVKRDDVNPENIVDILDKVISSIEVDGLSINEAIEQSLNLNNHQVMAQ